MSGWFQRSPDTIRPKNVQREIIHHRNITPSVSSQDSTALTTGGGKGEHVPLTTTKSTPLSHSPSISSTSERGTENQPQNGSSSTEIVELQKELSRLQEREVSLSHKLALEREYRVRAEQLVEVERFAYHELKYRLHLEKKHRYIGVDQGNGRVDGAGGGSDSTEGGVDFTDADISEEQFSDTREREGQEESSCTTDLFSPMTAEFNFSTSVFGQLTNDLQKILGGGQNQDIKSKSFFSQALDAVKSNDSATLQDCVPLLEVEDGLPLLKLAAERDHNSCLRVLLSEKKFDPNNTKSNGATPLHVASMHGQIKSVAVLLEFGVALDPVDVEGHTPLFLALRGGHSATARKIVEAGASLDVISNAGHTLLHAAVLGRLPGSLHSLLICLRVHSDGKSKVQELVGHKDEDFRTALHIAASKGLRGCTEVLCACGELDVGQRDRWNCTPLDVASGDTKEILVNRDSKSIILYVRISASSVPPMFAKSLSLHGNAEEEAEFSVAVGDLNILRHHCLGDLAQMVLDSLHNFSSYVNANGTDVASCVSATCNSSSGCGLNDDHLVLSERVSKRYQLARSIIKPGSGSKFRDGPTDKDSQTGAENGNLERDSYLQHCKNVLKGHRSRSIPLELTNKSIESFSIGAHVWKTGNLPNSLRSKNLFSLMSEISSRGSKYPSGVHIKLNGASQNGLDQLSFELMMPLPQLKDCAQMLEKEKKLVIHGPHGNGKSHLARCLARYLKVSLGESQTKVINTFVDETFDRDDLFRLLHSNQLLEPAMTDGAARTTKSKGEIKIQILILNHLSSTSHPGVLAHLTSLLESREAGLSLWVNEVPSCQEEVGVAVPGGLYYMKDECYVIATWTGAESGITLPPAVVDHFPHISMGMNSELCSGVLRRHLLVASIHYANGVWPHSAQPFYRLVQWVGDVWLLYNQFMADLGLALAPTGLKHFLSCPVNSLSPEKEIPKWFVSTWHYHLAPSVQSVLKNHVGHKDPSSLVIQTLTALVGLVVMPTCPLSCDSRDDIVQDLCEILEEYGSTRQKLTTEGFGLVGETTPNSCPLFHSYHSTPSSVTETIPSSIGNIPSSTGNIPSSTGNTPSFTGNIPSFTGTAPRLGQRRGSLQSLSLTIGGHRSLLQRRTPIGQYVGSLTDLRSSPTTFLDKPGNLVSYEDMIKNAPRSNKKPPGKSDPPEAPLTPTTTTTTTTISISPPEDTAKKEEQLVKEEKNVTMKTSTKEGVGKKIRKIRSKTIRLFSKDGSGTLPRLFRRSSRTPLTSVTEEDSKTHFMHSISNRHSSFPATNIPIPGSHPIPKLSKSISKPEFTQSLDETNLAGVYQMITAANSQYKDPGHMPSSSPVQNGNSDMTYETMNTTEALQDLDEFLDLMSESTPDQIDKQSDSSLSKETTPHGEVGNSGNTMRGLGFTRYYLSTGSPWQMGHEGGGMRGGASPPVYSMPDLTMTIPNEEEEIEEEARRVLHTTSCSSQHSLPSYSSIQHPQQRHLDSSGEARVLKKAVERQYIDQLGCGCNQWDCQHGGIQAYDPSPTKQRLSNGQRQSPSSLTVMSYSRVEDRSPGKGETKYFTYHVGRQTRPGLQHSVSEDPNPFQDLSRVKAAHPWYSNSERTQELFTEAFDANDLDQNCNSPIGRLDVWNDTDDHSPKEKLPSSKRVRHKSESLQTNKLAAIPPPLDILKKRASVGNTHPTYQGDQPISTRVTLQKQQHVNLSGDSNDSSDNISSKIFCSGTIFGTVLGSSGNLTERCDEI